MTAAEETNDYDLEDLSSHDKSARDGEPDDARMSGYLDIKGVPLVVMMHRHTPSRCRGCCHARHNNWHRGQQQPVQKAVKS